MRVKLCFLRNEAAKSLISSRRPGQFMSEGLAGATTAGTPFLDYRRIQRRDLPAQDGGGVRRGLIG
jgi:hypothetical protein